MNDKIKTLAYEAGLYSQGTPDNWDEDALERFGMMIVRECMERLRQEGCAGKIQLMPEPYSTYKFAAMYDAAIILKEHFGVE